MSAPLLTYQDAYEHLLDVFEQSGKNVGTQDRRLRRAIIEAYRLLPSIHDWQYFRRTGLVITSEPESHPGSYTASNKRITISSGTWNANADFGSVRIDSVRYPVARRISDTVVELEGGPASNITSGTFDWRQYRYLLPIDVGDIIHILEPRSFSGIRRLPMKSTFWFQEAVTTETYPYGWSLGPSRNHPGRMELWFTGSGQTERSIRFLYQVRYTNLDITEINSGTVTVDGNSATFTESVLTSSAVGAVLRVASDALVPTSVYGRLERDRVQGREKHVLRPPEYETRIVEVTSPTEAVLANSLTATPEAGRGYTISSHVNVNFEGMWELFLRMAEERYDILSRKDTAILNASRSLRLDAQRLAMGADSPLIETDTPGGSYGRIIVEESS